MKPDINSLIKELRSGVCCFYFKKKCGEIRKATGTLSQPILERYIPTPKDIEDKVRKRMTSLTSTAYFDLEKGEFRSFLWDNFIGMDKDYSL